MRVLVTNKDIGLCEGAILEDAHEYSKVFGGYIGKYKGITTVIGTEDGAIIVEDKDVESNLHILS